MSRWDPKPLHTPTRGERFGFLKLTGRIRRVRYYKSSIYQWEARCICGTLVWYENGFIRHSIVHSCRCLKKGLPFVALKKSEYLKLLSLIPKTRRLK